MPVEGSWEIRREGHGGCVVCGSNAGFFFLGSVDRCKIVRLSRSAGRSRLGPTLEHLYSLESERSSALDGGQHEIDGQEQPRMAIHGLDRDEVLL